MHRRMPNRRRALGVDVDQNIDAVVQIGQDRIAQVP